MAGKKGAKRVTYRRADYVVQLERRVQAMEDAYQLVLAALFQCVVALQSREDNL